MCSSTKVTKQSFLVISSEDSDDGGGDTTRSMDFISLKALLILSVSSQYHPHSATELALAQMTYLLTWTSKQRVLVHPHVKINGGT
jgi:hypothetical protein